MKTCKKLIIENELNVQKFNISKKKFATRLNKCLKTSKMFDFLQKTLNVELIS
jgi:hypothetical protein